MAGIAASDEPTVPFPSITPTRGGRWAVVGVSRTSTSSKTRLAWRETSSLWRSAQSRTFGVTHAPSRRVCRVRRSSRSGCSTAAASSRMPAKNCGTKARVGSG